MDQGPLVIQDIEAGEEFVRRLNDYAPVKAAFWVKDVDERQWYLYITSERIDREGKGPAYDEVLRLIHEIGNPYFDPFSVKLIPTSDPLARAALDIYRRFPEMKGTRLDGSYFGDRVVDGLFLYPASVTATAS